MKAEREDAPEYLTRRKNRKPWIPWVIGAACSIAFWMLAARFMQPITIDLNKLASAITIGRNAPSRQAPDEEETWNTPVSSSPYRTSQAVKQAESFSEFSERLHDTPPQYRQHRSTEGRQTVFNDSNYQPKAPINIYEAPRIASNIEPYQPRNVARRIVRSNRYKWEVEHGKWRRANFQWVEVDGEIDWSTVCQNLRKGSIEYRDCRKGAKVRFKEICGSYRPACRAENNFMP